MRVDVARFKKPRGSWNEAFELAAAEVAAATSKGTYSRYRGGSLVLARPVGEVITLDAAVSLPANTIVDIGGPAVQGAVGIAMASGAGDVAFTVPAGQAPVSFRGLFFDACRVEITAGHKGYKLFDLCAWDGTTTNAAIRALGAGVDNLELRSCLFHNCSQVLDKQGGGAWSLDNASLFRTSAGVERALHAVGLGDHPDGLELFYTDVSEVDVAPGRCHDSTRTRLLRVTSPITVNVAISGENGLDTGTEANSTWYYVYVIGKEDGSCSALCSANATTPTLPAGYSFFRRVGAFYNDSSGDILKFVQWGAGREREYQWDQPNPKTEFITNSGTTGTFNIVFAPPACRRILVLIWLTPASSGGHHFRLRGPNQTSHNAWVETTDTNGSWRGQYEVWPENGQVQVQHSNSGNRVYCYLTGWWDDLSLGL